MSFADAGGIVTHYLDEGPRDRPALVFINSLGTDLRLWDRMVPFFREDYRLVRYDKRGHGLSDSPAGPYSLDDLVGDLDALLTHLHVETATLVGISIGGLIALGYALRRPDAVSHMILCDTAARIGSDELWNARIESVSKMGMQHAAFAILPIWFSDGFASAQPALHQGFLNMLARMPAEGYVASCAALRDSDLRDRLVAIRARALVLTGEHDKATPPSQGQALAEALTEARFELIEGAGHLPCVEKPEVMGQRIRTFLQEQAYV